MKQRTSRKRFLLTTAILIAVDMLSINIASLAAIALRLNISREIFSLMNSYFPVLKVCCVPATVVSIVCFALFRLYTVEWVYAGEKDLIRILLASVCAAAFCALISDTLDCRFPRSFPFLFAPTLAVLLCASRFLTKHISRLRIARKTGKTTRQKRTMIIGAGKAGAMLALELETNERSTNKAVCIIDDDRSKLSTYVRGIRVVGGRESIPEAVKKYDVEEIVFCIPSAPPAERHEILNICSETGAQIRTVPSLSQLLSGEAAISQIKDVSIDDLLGRTEIRADNNAIAEKVCGQVVLVTGGGGSIGSELCRQLAKLSPRQLIIFDIYENNAYDIQQELKRKYPNLDLVVLIGSVRDEARVRYVFDTYRPSVVCHAAAHKHVPLMEDSPAESIKNNVFGTYNTAKAAGDYGASLFILISTDKAVNPTNVMGASKRLCEMVVQSMNGRNDTRYIAVRFGNVLGSNGSVIPLFKKQIAAGGPVTVTDKRVTRFFMTIPEAVSLILQAGAFAKGGEVFILDMGKPVKIDDMARKLIRLSGYEPDVDIKIEYTGLRPGEKLYEELLLESEGLQMTDNELIYIGHQRMYTEQEIAEKMEVLRGVLQAPKAEVRETVFAMIREPVDTSYSEIPGAVNPPDTVYV